VAVFGVGGLGMSAIQLAKALGAANVYAVDIKQDKLELASQYGAVPVDASRQEAVEAIRELTRGKGVDVALEMIGLPGTIKQTVESLGAMGRAVIVGICPSPLEIDPYRTLIGREIEIMGSNDHLLQELPLLIDLARRKVLDTSQVVSQTLPLDAEKINQRLDDLENFTSDIRAVIAQPD
jgi:propanol-preferring alcohol dehydrogenase